MIYLDIVAFEDRNVRDTRPTLAHSHGRSSVKSWVQPHFLMAEWFSQFDLQAYLPYASVADLAADIVRQEGVAESSHTALSLETAVLAVTAGTATSCMSYRHRRSRAPNNDSEAEVTNARMIAREVLKIEYLSACRRNIAQVAYTPKPFDPNMSVQTFLHQTPGMVWNPNQLAAVLHSKGCDKLDELSALLQQDPQLFAKMRMHSGHQQILLQDIHFGVNGSWPQNSLVPAPTVCKSSLVFSAKHKSSCYLQPTATIVLADRRSHPAASLRAGIRILSFDIKKSRILNTKVEACSWESPWMFGHRAVKRICTGCEALFKVSLLDQLMKEYSLVVMGNQLFWGLTEEGYSWLCAGQGETAPTLKPGDKLMDYTKNLCAVVEIAPLKASRTDRLVYIEVRGSPTLFIDGFLACCAVSS